MSQPSRGNQPHYGQQAHPFLKWAGGKGALLRELLPFFPKALEQGELPHYYEPFLGGGAVFFYVAQHYPLERAFLFDTNPELINAFRCIRDRVEELLPLLSDWQDQYRQAGPEERKTLYYRRREEFNALKAQGQPLPSEQALQSAALFVFLNKTCYNGLYRLNQKGAFNTPIGRYANPRLFHPDNLRAAAKLLQKAELHCHDFAELPAVLKPGSFVYLDPPYRPLSATANFNFYSGIAFSDQEQQRLKATIDQVDRQGAHVLLNNSDPRNQNPDDDFFELLYQNYRIDRVRAARYINSQGDGRGLISELVIRNYGP